MVSADDGNILDGSVRYEVNTSFSSRFKEAALGVSAGEIMSKLWSCLMDNAGQVINPLKGWNS